MLCSLAVSNTLFSASNLVHARNKFTGTIPFLLVLGPVGKLAPSLHCNLLVARCSVPRSTCSSLVGIPATGPRVLVFDTMHGTKMHLFSLVHRIVFGGGIELQSQLNALAPIYQSRAYFNLFPILSAFRSSLWTALLQSFGRQGHSDSRYS